MKGKTDCSIRLNFNFVSQFISIIIVSVPLLISCREAAINDITKDLIDLLVATEDPDDLMDAVVLKSVKTRNNRVLYMELINMGTIESYSDNTVSKDWHFFSVYKGRKVLTYGNSSIWWTGKKRQVDIHRQMNKNVNWDWTIWKIVLHPDNTLNSFLTIKNYHEQDISDIESVFRNHSLFKDDSSWAAKQIFSGPDVIIFDQPVFTEPNNIVQYLKKNPVMGEDSVKNVCPVVVKVLINTDGSLQYQGISFGVGGVVPKMSREQKKGFKDLGMAICSEFKVVPVEYRGHRIRYESEIPVWPIREVLSYCIYQQSL